MPPPEPRSPNLELLRRLSVAGVEFVVVGGVAAALHGSSLVTIDLDLCAPFSTENLTRLLPELIELGARFRAHPERPNLENDPERFSRFRLLMLETALGPLDVLREIDGVGAYPDVKRASVRLDLGELRVRVLGLEALIAAKRAAGREKDLRALPELEATLRLRRRDPSGRKGPGEA